MSPNSRSAACTSASSDDASEVSFTCPRKFSRGTHTGLVVPRLLLESERGEACMWESALEALAIPWSAALMLESESRRRMLALAFSPFPCADSSVPGDCWRSAGEEVLDLNCPTLRLGGTGLGGTANPVQPMRVGDPLAVLGDKK
jgi:hypothetical protein